MGAFIFIIVVVILLLCVLSGNAEHEKYEAKKRDEEKKALEKKYADLRIAEIRRVGQPVNFQYSKGTAYLYSAKDGQHVKITIFFVDDCNKRFMVGAGECGRDKTTGEPIIDWICPVRCYNYNQLLEFFIVDNGSQYIAGDASGAIGGAMVGNMIGGSNGPAVGAIIGAAATNRNIESKCHELGLLLRINDLQHPLVRMNFLECRCSRESEMYRKGREWLDDVAALLTYVKHNA